MVFRSVSVLLIVFLFLFPVSASAQAFDFNRAYADYTYSLALYQKAHSEYEVARSVYLQNKTLSAREEAQNKTRTMLQSRDTVMKTYLTAIRMKLAETAGVDSSQRESLYALIDTEVSWFESHKNELNSSATLEDLVKDSDEARDRYLADEIMIYRSLTTVLVGKLNNFQEKVGKIISDTQAKVSEIRVNGDKDVAQVDRWLLDATERVRRSQEKEDEAVSIINKIKATDKNKASAYSQAQFRISESHLFLKEANSILKQIVIDIKTAD